MLSREQIQKKIAELNARENEIIAANPIRKLESSGPKPFPMMAWALALACAGAWQYGPAYARQYISKDIAAYCSYGAAGLGGLAALLTLRWMFAGRSKTAQHYQEANRKLEALRKERGLLEDQLKHG
jgi:hypothetical protein